MKNTFLKMYYDGSWIPRTPSACGMMVPGPHILRTPAGRWPAIAWKQIHFFKPIIGSNCCTRVAMLTGGSFITALSSWSNSRSLGIVYSLVYAQNVFLAD